MNPFSSINRYENCLTTPYLKTGRFGGTYEVFSQADLFKPCPSSSNLKKADQPEGCPIAGPVGSVL